MTTRKSPFTHPDGSNCWTNNCSRGRKKASEITANIKEREDTIKEIFNSSVQGVPTIDLIAKWEEFEQAIADGRIMAGRHSVYPELRILKYSQVTNFSKDWDEITSASRGLIVNTETGEILARPFSKFFNWNESNAPQELMRGPIEVTEKEDGSLGILYTAPGGEIEISTAGGLQSDQAGHATQLYRERYHGKWNPDSNYTYLFEIIYPQNRIVLDYGDTDDLFLLGKVNKMTGTSIPLSKIDEWKWNRAAVIDNFDDLSQITASENRPNHEGYIIHYLDTDARVKYKHEEYVALHRVMTGLSSRRIHELLASGGIKDFQVNMPEEFQKYFDDTVVELQNQYDSVEKNVYTTYKKVRESLPADVDKKTFAQTIIGSGQDRLTQGLLFKLFEREELDDRAKKTIWDSIKPAYERGFWATGSGNDEE